jgi:hypothetical protein
MTNGIFIAALNGLNIESPGQRPGIIMVTNIQVPPPFTLPAPFEIDGRGEGEGGGMINGVI